MLKYLTIALLTFACSSPVAEPYTLADTYGVPGACVVRTTDAELLLLRCSPNAELSTECRGDASADVQAELWTRPGADATPYGVTGRLVLTCTADGS